MPSAFGFLVVMIVFLRTVFGQKTVDDVDIVEIIENDEPTFLATQPHFNSFRDVPGTQTLQALERRLFGNGLVT